MVTYGLFLILFSVIVNGLGWLLYNIATIGFLLVFRCKLHTIKEPKKSATYNIPYLSKKFIFLCIAVGLFVSLTIVFNYDQIDIMRLHFQLMFNNTLIFILIPKYYVSQNPNLKLYVSLYYHQPPPILPWQLPLNFDPNSVKLIYVKHGDTHVSGKCHYLPY